MSRILLQRGGVIVTDRLLKTRRRVYDLSRVDAVFLRQPLLIFVAVLSAGAVGFAAAFWAYLYPNERIALIAAPVLATLAASRIATLTLHSLSHRGEDESGVILGPIWRLARVKDAVEAAMRARLG